MLGIGASSSAAYTLRKHYTKNLLAFECHYDRGDIDPLPIIQQVEAGTKKKSTKAASVPSPGKLQILCINIIFESCLAYKFSTALLRWKLTFPFLKYNALNNVFFSLAGSSNSQDSFPAPGGANNAAMDGYPQYAGGYPTPGPQSDYGAAGQMPRPPSQNNAPSPHPGKLF